MKNGKWFLKLLSMMLTISIVYLGNAQFGCVRAMDCRSVVEYLSENSVLLKNGDEFWLFNHECADSERAWNTFTGMMSKKFGDLYTLNASAEKNPKVLDSINFLFLLLHFYQKSFERMIDAENAKQATQMLHLMFRNFSEQAVDKAVLQGLSEVYTDFNDLKQILA